MDSGFVDCHCHISAREFEEDLEDVIQRSSEVGVETLVAVTEEVGEFERVLQLTERTWMLPGLTSTNTESASWLLERNVHSRSAAQVTIATMREQGISRALLHNFAGRPSAALEGVKAGYLFSFPPAVCRNQQRDRLIRQIPLEHICLETDSPSLGLEKHVRNEPCNIVLSCRYIADVKGVSPETVRLVTSQNAYRLFPKADTRGLRQVRGSLQSVSSLRAEWGPLSLCRPVYAEVQHSER
ncbi:putative deoxyribonuclease tatdn3 isoform X6 [Notolabrus celidotus]|uniref:putative deoxyribonuclease tatdn3 isoform X6 n=1 Tax=Notolabrus celidotus TaxID=1203425 RepID=UPI00148F52D2|nr:putative deoxyribonuclease tatdn3 isoform X6 [Notolabrus celidotus]